MMQLCRCRRVMWGRQLQGIDAAVPLLHGDTPVPFCGVTRQYHQQGDGDGSATGHTAVSLP